MGRNSLIVFTAAAFLAAPLLGCDDPEQDEPDSLRSDALMSELSEEDLLEVLTEEADAWFPGVPLEELCIIHAIAFSQLPLMGGESPSCAEALDDCLALSTELPPEDLEVDVEHFADCHVSVEEYRACFEDDIAITRQLGQDSSCEEGYPEYAGEDYFVVPSCEAIADRCPALDYEPEEL